MRPIRRWRYEAVLVKQKVTVCRNKIATARHFAPLMDSTEVCASSRVRRKLHGNGGLQHSNGLLRGLPSRNAPSHRMLIPNLPQCRTPASAFFLLTSV
eukprot:1162013-Pelagomonas_calceolata.AAC.4